VRRLRRHEAAGVAPSPGAGLGSWWAFIYPSPSWICTAPTLDALSSISFSSGTSWTGGGDERLLPGTRRIALLPGQGTTDLNQASPPRPISQTARAASTSAPASAVVLRVLDDLVVAVAV
jgi:hypothetical protein